MMAATTKNYLQSETQLADECRNHVASYEHSEHPQEMLV